MLEETAQEVARFKLIDLDQEPQRIHASSSRKAIVSSVRATSSADFTENRSSRIVPNNGHSSTAQLTQLVPDPNARPSSSSSFARAGPSRTSRETTLQNFELLTIGNGKRK
ncbi:hypothetical protein YC2023_084346 [Brassica napus]